MNVTPKMFFRSVTLLLMSAALLLVMLLGPKDAAAAVQPQDGTWWNEKRAGHSVDIQNIDGDLEVVWYTYDQEGLPVWYRSRAPLDAANWSADLYRFTWADGKPVGEVVGAIDLQLQSAEQLNFSWELNGEQGSEVLEIFKAADAPAAEDRTGHWRPGADARYGWSVTTQGSSNEYSYLHFYDDQGQPRWALGANGGESGDGYTLSTYTGFCPGCPAEPTEGTEVGTLKRTFAAAGQATLSVDLTLTGPLSGDLSIQEEAVERFVPQNQTPAPAPAPQPEGSALNLVEGQDNQPVAELPMPAKGESAADPSYGTNLTRMTDHAAEAPADFARNYYSRRQAFNADDSQVLVHSGNGYWHLYDVNTHQHIKQLPEMNGDSEPVWHPEKPNLLFYVKGTKVMQMDVSSGDVYEYVDFSGQLPWSNVSRTWTRWEGTPSRDTRYWAFMAEDDSGNTQGIFTWDLETGKILGTHGTDGKSPDHLSMSPSGEYVVVSWLDGVVAYTRDFQSQQKLTNKSAHSDITYDAGGNEVLVAADYDSGHVFMAKLANGERTDLFEMYIDGTWTAMHFSGQATNKPGWVLMSTYADGGGSRQWLHNKIFAVELTANPRVLNIAHHRARYTDYWSEPHASVNRDFTKVLFNSNWGTGNGVDTYLIDLPQGTIQ